MAGPPDTRYTLIARLPAASIGGVDQSAWQEFVHAYQPFLYSFARRNGLQDSDARELVQKVLVSVSGSIERFQASEPGEERPKFRSWLRVIARNHLLNHLKTMSRNRGSGGTTNLRQLNELCDFEGGGRDALDDEFRKAAFRHCAARVQREVKPETWQAFWLTAVEGQSCGSVAQHMEMRLGSVYAARSRVIARMRAAVSAFWDDNGEAASSEEANSEEASGSHNSFRNSKGGGHSELGEAP